MTPDQLDSWRRTAALDSRTGQPVGDALLNACNEIERMNERLEYLNGRVADLREYEVGIKHLTTEDGSINMSLALAHDQMRIFVAAFQKVLDEEGGPNYVEMSFKLAGTLDRYTVTIKRPNGETPADVASKQRARAEKAEADRDRAREIAVALEQENARVRELHSPYKIYDECGHRHTATDKGVQDVTHVGLACEDGYMYTVCRHCCTDAMDDQTEECVSEHDHGKSVCPTNAALDGSEAL